MAEQSIDTSHCSYRLLDLDLLLRYQSWALSVSRSGNLAKLVELVFVHPVISIANVDDWLEVTQRAASRLVGRMVDDGISVEVMGRQRNRQFTAR